MLIAFANLAQAGTPLLDSITDSDFNTVSQEFSTTFVHTSVSPPTSLGKVFGVEASLVAGAHQSKRIEDLAKKFDPNAQIGFIPHAMVNGMVSVPFGVTIETNVLPQLDLQGLKLKHFSGAVKWSLTDAILPNLPFDLAVRTYYSTSEIGYNQTVPNGQFGNVNSDVTFKCNMVGGDLMFGIDLPGIDPYVGFGYVKSNATLSAHATASVPYSIFSDGVSDSKSNAVESSRIIAGVQVKLIALATGVEYSYVFGAHRASAKLALSF